MKYKCPCCENSTLLEKPTGTHQICPICKCEDDEIQYYNPDYKGGANKESLNEARRIYREQQMEE